jgi:hypothetical protein
MSKAPDRIENLDAEVQRIRERYFPRWRSFAQWRIFFIEPHVLRGPQRIGNDVVEVDAHARCYYDHRAILLSYALAENRSRSFVSAIIIHEMVHATGPHDHGKRFLDRLGKACETAEKAGDRKLAYCLAINLLKTSMIYSSWGARP